MAVPADDVVPFRLTTMTTSGTSRRKSSAELKTENRQKTAVRSDAKYVLWHKVASNSSFEEVHKSHLGQSCMLRKYLDT